MATCDQIAQFILEALEEEGGIAELRRAALADQFNCVPSQINYVISTPLFSRARLHCGVPPGRRRFNPDYPGAHDPLKAPDAHG